MHPPVSESALLALYRAWGRVGLSAIHPAGAVVTLILIGVGASGCSLSRSDAFAKMDDKDVTGAISPTQVSAAMPTESDLAFARNAASDVLTKGDKDSSQSWEKPRDGCARLGDAAGPGLFGRGRQDVPGLPRELCQWSHRELATGRRL